MFEDFALDAETFSNRLIKWQLFSLRVMGFMFARTDSFKLFHFTRGIFVTFSLLLLVTSQVRIVWLHPHDLEGIIPGAATSLVYINVISRIIAFYWYRKRYNKLLTNLQSGVRKILATNSPSEMRVYNNYIDYIIKIVYTILLPLLIAVILVSVEGVYFIIYQSDGWTVQRQVGNTSTGMNHLFVLYPTGSLSESFLFTFILPFYMVSIGLFSFFAWHTFNTALMRYISFRLDVVKYRLENMLKETKQQQIHTTPSLESIERDYVDILLKNSQPAESAPQLPELLKAILISCVEDITEQNFIFSFTNEYELVSRITLFFESSTISGLLCMQLYIISKDFFSGYGVYQFWCVATIGLLWLYYWHADEISQKSNEITNALYSFNWYEAPLPLQKDIALFMGSSMRPIIMKSGFINMNVNTFFTILKTSYSYFTLLQNFAK
ncbi:unnamed protein product [Hermetia illucens]|uniref:Odorant receptor n=1 Tax=Hermetia illucens TaxID=343691 RepID=A0A7R8UCX2_HERIL|nr:unnamed protein product [Hermetia illucens]